MSSNGRSQLLCAGGKTPKALGDIARARGLEAEHLDVDAIDPQEHYEQNPYAVAVICDPGTIGKLRGWLTRLLHPVLDTGSLLLVVAEEGQYAEASAVSLSVMKELGTKPYQENAVLVKKPDFDDLASWFNTHEPSTRPDSKLIIITADRLANEEEQLLRRAFNGFSKIELRTERGGRSPETHVWRVRPWRSKGERCEPYIVKAGRPRALQEERQTSHEMIFPMPFPFRAPIVDARCVTGSTRALLVSMFVSRAHRFDKYLGVVEGPELAVTALFDGPLRNWRHEWKETSNPLGTLYVEAQREAKASRESEENVDRTFKEVLPDPDRLSEAFASARVRNSRIPTPEQVYDMLARLPAIEYRECKMHGDLNARNLFVRWNGVDVILIDFSHAGDLGPMSRDPSRLEVSIAFDVRDDGNRYLSSSTLTRLYQSPLLPPPRLDIEQDGRVAAIRQIRCHIGGEGVRNDEYEITTACHLLRHARRPREEGRISMEKKRLRSMSYLLAARLIVRLKDRLTGTASSKGPT